MNDTYYKLPFVCFSTTPRLPSYINAIYYKFQEVIRSTKYRFVGTQISR